MAGGSLAAPNASPVRQMASSQDAALELDEIPGVWDTDEFIRACVKNTLIKSQAYAGQL
jgi:hypothetical protein